MSRANRIGDIAAPDANLRELLDVGFPAETAIGIRAFGLFLENRDAVAGPDPLTGRHPAMLWATQEIDSLELLKQLAPGELEALCDGTLACASPVHVDGCFSTEAVVA